MVAAKYRAINKWPKASMKSRKFAHPKSTHDKTEMFAFDVDRYARA